MSTIKSPSKFYYECRTSIAPLKIVIFYQGLILKTNIQKQLLLQIKLTMLLTNPAVLWIVHPNRKLDWVAPLVPDPPCGHDTTRQNSPSCVFPPYISITSETNICLNKTCRIFLDEGWPKKWIFEKTNCLGVAGSRWFLSWIILLNLSTTTVCVKQLHRICWIS